MFILLARITIILMSIFLLISCGKDETDTSSQDQPGVTKAYVNSTLPSQVTIAIPKTLSTQTLSSPSQKITAFKVRKKISMATRQTDEESFGYAQLKMLVDQMKQTAQFGQLEMMMIDAFFSEAGDAIKAATGCVEAGTYTISFTEEMRNALIASFDDIGYDEADVEDVIESMETEDFFPEVGDQMPNPTMRYMASQNGYDHELSYGYGGGYDDSTTAALCDGGLTDVLRWNTDQQKLQFGFKDSFGEDSFSGMFSVDFNDKTMTFKNNYKSTFTGETYDQTVTMKECNMGTDKCVTIKMVENYENAFSEKWNYELEGKADNNGGFIDTKSKWSDGSIEETYYYKEYFDGEGTLVGLKESTDGGLNYDNYTGYEDYDSTYDDYDVIDVGLTDVFVCNITSFISSDKYTDCSVDCHFEIYPSNVTDPLANPDTILAYGEYYSDEFGVDFWVDYWGDPALVDSASVWVITDYATDGFPVYEEATGAIVSTELCTP